MTRRPGGLVLELRCLNDALLAGATVSRSVGGQ
jgi:hypothetical protein